uniref:KASH domain containing 5 n=1 Tax=Spermophilus dauricus TaxID=99837 RepID=A0A8C9P0J1_SPEDA
SPHFQSIKQVGAGAVRLRRGWKQVLRAQRPGKTIPLLVLPGALWAAGPFPIPYSDGGRLVASIAAVERQEWPMDLPEGRAGGPATEMYLWEQPEEVSPGPLLSLEEQILNSTFEACDPQRTGGRGRLGVWGAVTGQGPQDSRLQTLARSLDPKGEGPGATVDLDTFLVVMRNWIAACQLVKGAAEEQSEKGPVPSCLPPGFPEAEEPANLESFGGEDTRPEMPATADLLSSLEDLELSNRRLAGENAKLQRSVETAEEGSARLTEEILALRRQLRSTQQALQFAKAVDEELEDLKSLAKSLEEKNRGLLAQARQTEKEQQYLVAEVETLQEENGKLLAERDGVRRRSEELATEKDALKRQLYEYERLICQRDAILSERTRHTESLAKTLEEYRMTTQVATAFCPPWLSSPPSFLKFCCLSFPCLFLSSWIFFQVCTSGFFHPCCMTVAVFSFHLFFFALFLFSFLPHSVSLARVLHQWADPGPLPLKDPVPQPCLLYPPRLIPRSLWETLTLKTSQESLLKGNGTHGDRKGTWGTNKKLSSDSLPFCFPSSSVESEFQQALVPVVKELVPVRRPWCQCCLHPQRLRVTQHPLVPAPILGLLLLLLLLSVLLLGQSQPPTWPHLQLCYLQPPPV